MFLFNPVADALTWPSISSIRDSIDYVALAKAQAARLRETVGQLAPVSTTQHGPVTAYVPATLMRALSTGAQGGPLQPPYKVLEHNPKAFLVD